ncbi:ABC transporter ATP-binding protein [Xanthobacter dioxanivorans]|uniref:ABC transporter ATP-binding protein n=2 Tax=Xanthobacter dioxanivorans TaxID=2528964 RepID=A0A974PN30_9HYPH|nr:ABC transporter ATP-binding protein [Xanthobacter dioxanivorans]
MLRVSNINSFYGAAHILHDLSITMGAGETVALLGRNGAGKSTLMKSIIGIVTPRSGAVSFKGEEIAGLEPFAVARRGIGFVPEDRRIFVSLSVAENLEVGRRSARSSQAGWTPERLYEVFPNLAEMRGRQAGHMSGGEQQMLTIARTLMGNPELILLDEPSEGLAPKIVEQMADAILRLGRTGMTVLISEQNMHFAGLVSERAYVIEKGQIKFSGTMQELMGDEDIRRNYLAL